jgi:hypothetical protein
MDKKKNREPKMSMQMTKIGKRYKELRAQGIPGKEAVETVNREFGTRLTAKTVQGYASRPKQPEKQTQGAPGDEVLDLALDNRMRIVAREVFDEMLHNMPTGRNIIQEAEEPPEPETVKGAGKGRRENRDYQKVSITIDTVLWDKIIQERDRMKASTGRAIDAILWRCCNKPLLSYQLPEPELKALQKKYPKPEKKKQ